MHQYVCAGNADRMAQLSIEAGLFADDGTMKFLFEEAIENRDQFAMAMYYVDDIAVGSIIAVRETGEVNAYVNPGHRGDGIGQKLVNMLLCTSGLTRHFLYAQHGRDEERSLAFWRKARIYVPPDKFVLSRNFRDEVVDSEAAELEIDQKIAQLYVDDLKTQNLKHHIVVSELVRDAKMSIPGYTDLPEYQAFLEMQGDF